MEQPIVKDLKFINTYEVLINGDEFIKKMKVVHELEHIANHVHFNINGHVIHINGNMCLRCGEVFKKQITSHHALPNMLKPKYNVFLPLCDKCHVELNRLYKGVGKTVKEV